MRHPLHGAEFLLAAANDSQLPAPGPFEIAFAGRSNAGKSSAINALAGRTRLAFTSKTPGRTQQIVFFRLRCGALLADLPGYGYAAVPQTLKRHWQDFLARYVATRQSLVGLVLVVDARHGLAALDHRLLAAYLPSGRPVLVLATKMDKLGRAARIGAQRGIESGLRDGIAASQVRVIGFSATRHQGIGDADAILAHWLGAEPPAMQNAAHAADAALPPAKDSRARFSAAPKKRPRAQGE